ncbi:hypothetical protein [Streptosporangium sp. NPDC051022]|uniref:bacteriocin-associated integral membrane family protein n=1 Tax=Streptosporangium sp. NPDC051022 TaxID=3155752 RepID=UPI00342FF561
MEVALIHRGLKAALVVILLSSCVIAFSVLHRVDGDIIMGSDYALRVTDKQGQSNSDQAVREIAAFASRNRVNIARFVPDLHDARKRYLYLASGDPEAVSTRWKSSGYPSFNQDTVTEVRDIVESSNIDPRGYYYVFGSSDIIGALQVQFAELGLRTTLVPLLNVTTVLRLFFNQALQWLFLIICAAIISITGLSAIFNSKFYGIQRLHGRSFGQIILADLTQIAIFYVRATPLAALITTVFLYAYNKLNQVGVYAGLAVIFVALLLTLSFIIHVIAVALTFRISITGAIKGEIAAIWAILSSYTVRILAIVITFTVAVDVLASWQRLDSQEKSQSQWTSAGGAVRILLNGALDKESDQQLTTVGRWIRQEDNKGRVVLAVRRKLREFLQNAPVADVLLINNTYLAKQNVLLESGERVSALGDEKKIRVLIPPAHDRNRARIVDGLSEWVSFMADLSGAKKHDVVGLKMRAGQSLFTYGSGSASIRNPIVSDPIVIAIPSGSNLLPDKEYAAYATMASVVFLDPNDVYRARVDKRMAAYINGVQPISQRAAYEYQNSVRELNFQFGNLLITIVVILVTALGICLAYCRRNAQMIFVRFIHGWSFFSTYKKLFIFEVVLAIGAVAWVAQDTAFRMSFRENGTPQNMPPSVAEALTSVTGWEPTVVGVTVSVGVFLMLAVLAILNKRLIREISIDT